MLGGLIEADLTPIDKRRRIYGADHWAVEPDCDHGAALVTLQSRIIDIEAKYVCGRRRLLTEVSQ